MAEKRTSKRYVVRNRDERLLASIVRLATAPVDLAEWPQITKEWRRILQMGPLVVVGDAFASRWPASDGVRLHADLAAFFDGLADLRDDDGAGLMPTLAVGALQWSAAVVGDDVLLVVDGAPGDVIRQQAMRLVVTVGTERLSRCKDVDCSRVFVKVGRREYCSTTCQGRIYMREVFPEVRKRKQALARRKGRKHGKTRKR